MNYVCIKPEWRLNQEEIKISDSEVLTHLKDVLGKKAGDILKIKLLGEGVGKAVIKSMGFDQIVLEVCELERISETRNITLAIGACRPLMSKRIMEHGTTLGVKEFIFFKSFFSESSYLDSKVFKPANVEKYFTKGLAQTENVVNLPSFSKRKSIKEICLQSYDQKLYLHGPGDKYLSPKTSMKDSLIVFLGGERGWHESELQYFKNNSITEVAISESILRVEFAMQAFMAQAEWVKNARY
jgi:16S rRNA (uracil1498-N3)-methyltransferase